MWVAFASHFFSKKFQHICVSLDVNFNESLTNDVVSFEQLGPEWEVIKVLFYSYFLIEHMFCIFVWVAAVRWFLQISKPSPFERRFRVSHMIFITNFIVVSSVGIELTVFTARGAGLHWTLGSDLGRRRSQIRFLSQERRRCFGVVFPLMRLMWNTQLHFLSLLYLFMYSRWSICQPP